MAEVSLQKKKPVICNYMTDKAQWTGTTNILKGGGIPCYDFPEMAAKALAALTRFGKIRSRKIGKAKQFNDIDKNKADKIFAGAQKSNRQLLTAQEAYDVLTAYNIPVADWKVANDIKGTVEAAGTLGYPVVIKTDSESVIHKSDVGGVAVNIKDESALKNTAEEMKKKFDPPDLKFLVQKYLPGGRELIIGAKAEPGLGHLIMFGLGGIFVEVLKDVVFKIAPVTNVEAGEMLSSIKTSKLLDGIRGEKGVNKEGIIEIIQRISQLVTDFPLIQEMDLNPVIGYEASNFVVDVRIKI
jgi:acetyltransferase